MLKPAQALSHALPISFTRRCPTSPEAEMTKLEALLTAADDETRALVFQLAFPEKKKAALLLSLIHI